MNLAMVEYLIGADSLKGLHYCSSISKPENVISLILIAALAWTSFAQYLQLEWEQCGGSYYTGPTACLNFVCTYVNIYYSINHSPLSCVERNLSEIN
jgi:hypothetical protein